MPEHQPVIDRSAHPKTGIIWRFCRGLIGAAVAAGIGWIASRLTIGLMLARYLDSGQQQQIETVLPVVYLFVGFISGVAFDRRWFTAKLRPICWGAVMALTLLTLAVRIPLWLYPMLNHWRSTLFDILGLSLGWEKIGLLCVPGTLFVGGVLGWFFDRQIRLRRRPKQPTDFSSPND